MAQVKIRMESPLATINTWTKLFNTKNLQFWPKVIRDLSKKIRMDVIRTLLRLKNLGLGLGPNPTAAATTGMSTRAGFQKQSDKRVAREVEWKLVILSTISHSQGEVSPSHYRDPPSATKTMVRCGDDHHLFFKRVASLKLSKRAGRSSRRWAQLMDLQDIQELWA